LSVEKEYFRGVSDSHPRLPPFFLFLFYFTVGLFFFFHPCTYPEAGSVGSHLFLVTAALLLAASCVSFSFGLLNAIVFFFFFSPRTRSPFLSFFRSTVVPQRSWSQLVFLSFSRVAQIDIITVLFFFFSRSRTWSPFSFFFFPGTPPPGANGPDGFFPFFTLINGEPLLFFLFRSGCFSPSSPSV